MLSRSDVEVEYVGIDSEGAVFNFRTDLSEATTPEEVRELSREALDIVEIFCNRVIDGDERPVNNWDGVGSFDEWPAQGYRMFHKYRGLGGDWRQMTIVIGDRYLATCFAKVFCRAQPPRGAVHPSTEMS